MQTLEQTASVQAKPWKALLLAAFFSAAAFTAGLLAPPSLGDEISFYRLAKGFFYAHERTVIDPVYAKSGLIYYYNSEVLWPALLGAVWTFTGKESPVIAQTYHAAWFFLLIYATWILSRRWFTEKQSLFAAFILACTPMVAAFSILFYAEIPMMALAVSSAALLVRKKTAAAGILMSLACLTKLTSVFFIPAMLAFILLEKAPLRSRLMQAFIFIAPAVIAVLADSAWRRTHLNIAYLFSYAPEAVTSPSAWQTLKDRIFLKDAIQRFKELKQSGIWEYTNSSLLNLVDIVKYFGVISLGFCGLLVARRNRPADSAGGEGLRFCTLMSASYFACFLYLFLFSPDIRCLLPLAPFLAIMASHAAAGLLHKKLLLLGFTGICLLQFAGPAAVVVKQRTVPDDIRKGFSFIEKNVGEEELVIYPEYVLVEGSNRGMVWSHRFRDQLGRLFWDADKNGILDYLTDHRIRYIAIKKSRVYDDNNRKHFGGYPRSFVDSLKLQTRLRLVYENPEMSIWKIQP